MFPTSLFHNGSVVSAGIRGAGLKKEPENLLNTRNLDDSESSGEPPGLAVAAEKKSRAVAVARGL